jgi:hypothetical protein
MNTSTSSFLIDYHNFAENETPHVAGSGGGHRSSLSQQQQQQQQQPVLPSPRHIRKSSMSVRDVVKFQRQESQVVIRKGVLERIFDLDSSDDAQDLSQDHSYAYVTLHPRSTQVQSEIFKKFITSVIVFDLITYIVSTEPKLYQSRTALFHYLEGVTSCIFLLEYVARLATITENKRLYGYLGPIWGRLKWMKSFHAMIDLLATSPFFINVATGWEYPCLSYTRILRVTRILKTDGFIRAFGGKLWGGGGLCL